MKTILSLLTLSILFFGCFKNDPVVPSTKPTAGGGITLSFQKSTVPANVASIMATLSREGYDDIRRSMNFVTDTTATVTFDEVVVGTWMLEVKAYSADSVLKYQGTTEVTVFDGETTIVNLTMVPVTSGVGSVQVVVTWGTSDALNWKNWIHSSMNPVLADFDSINGNIGVAEPMLFVDNNKLKMTFMFLAGRGNGLERSIGLAESDDGKQWNIHPVPILAPGSTGSWDSYLIGPGPVFKVGGTYRMFYTGSTVALDYKIGLAISSNGEQWTKQEGPVFTSTGSWDYLMGVGDVINVNGKYYFFFNCTGNGITSIALATSFDGVNWERYGYGPVLSTSDEWEGAGINMPSVIYENGQFMMMYQSQAGQSFGIAVSHNGVNWIKYSNNPVIVKNNSHNSWAPDQIAYPSLKKFKGKYIVYYTGYTAFPLRYKIGFATLGE